MDHTSTVRAIDIGYGNTKCTISAARPQLACDLFPSCAPIAQPSAMGSDDARLGRDNVIVEVDGQRYEVGPDTRLFNDPRILHDDYTATPEYLALYRAALGLMNARNIDVLVTGLPVAHLRHRQAAVKQRLSGSHSTGHGFVVHVRQVYVIAQPLGGLLDHCVDQQGNLRGNPNDRHLLVDPGYYTLDWVLAEGLKELPGRSGSHSSGVSDILGAVAQSISNDTGYPFDDLTRLDDALRAGQIRIRGAMHDLTRYATDISDLWSSGLKVLRNSVGDGRDFDSICIVGGGAHLLMPALRGMFPTHPIVASDDPVFANVRGYQALGETWMRAQASGQ